MTSSQDMMLLDGATGSELERRGVDVSLPLWSARALDLAPEIIEAIHADYLAAGADVVVTNTFRTHRRSLTKSGMGERAAELTRQAVGLARAAVDRVGHGTVAGSVSPLEDCYHPELAPSDEVCRAEHREMMEQLLESGVDWLLIETMCSRREALAAAEVANEIAPGRWMLSFYVKSSGPPGTLADGNSMIDLLPELADAFAIGVNCLGAPAVRAHVALLRSLAPADMRVLAFGNTAAPTEGEAWAETDAADPARYAEYAVSWRDAGASVIGGCCGTTPETIAAVKAALKD